MVFSTSWLIMLGKLRIIWSGQKIVVSKLLRSRGPSLAEGSESPCTSSSKPEGVGGIVSDHDSMVQSVADSLPRGSIKIEGISEVKEPRHLPDQEVLPGNSGDIDDRDDRVKLADPHAKDATEAQPEHVSLSIAVNMRKPLPPTLEKSILYMRELLIRISHFSMTGIQVPKQELEKLRDKGKRFGDMCGRIVIESEDEGNENA